MFRHDSLRCVNVTRALSESAARRASSRAASVPCACAGGLLVGLWRTLINVRLLASPKRRRAAPWWLTLVPQPWRPCVYDRKRAPAIEHTRSGRMDGRFRFADRKNAVHLARSRVNDSALYHRGGRVRTRCVPNCTNPGFGSLLRGRVLRSSSARRRGTPVANRASRRGRRRDVRGKVRRV